MILSNVVIAQTSDSLLAPLNRNITIDSNQISIVKDSIDKHQVAIKDSTLFRADTILELVSTDTMKRKSVEAIKEPIYVETGYVVDYAPEYDAEVIEARIAATYSDVPLRFNNRINGFINYFAVRNRDYTRKMMRRANVYFPIIEEVLAKNNMPESIKYLAIVESGLDPKIRSWAGAMGLWQFMPATGKSFSLDYDYYIDERLDPYKATEAACKYLRQLYGMFGNWELALGAYNCGPGNMRKAIRRSGYKKTFEEVYNYLPKETRSYVPQFMAVNYVMRFTEEHNLYIEEWEKEYLPESKAIVCNQYLDINKLAELSGVCAEYFEQLNPEIKRNTITKEWKNYSLVLPKEFSDLHKDSISIMMDSASVKGEEALNYGYKNPNAGDLAGSTKIVYRVRGGDNLGKIAQRHRVSVRSIKNWNNMRNSTIYPGQRLSIYTKGVHKNGPSIKKTTKAAPKDTKSVEKVAVKEGQKVIHTVKKGEVIGSIASKYEVSITQVRSWNNISGNLIRVGQKLEIYNRNKIDAKKNVIAKKGVSVDKSKVSGVYTVKSGDALYNIAKSHGMSVDQLKAVNGLKNNRINIGDRLKVYKEDTKSKTVTNNSINNTKTYTVKSGDSLWSISRKLNLTIDQIKKWNNLKSNSLKPGQVLKLG